MNTVSNLTAAEFDSMAEHGAFDMLGRKKIELIRGEMRIKNPAEPVHEDCIDYLNRWSTTVTKAHDATIRVQSGFVWDENRPEPDVLWLKPQRYASDVLLLIEVADGSLAHDLQEKADIYAESGVAEYWVVDIPASRIHIMNDGDGKNFRSTEIAVPPHQPAPRCLPTAKLNIEELFKVK